MSKFEELFTKKELFISKIIGFHPSFWLMNVGYDREWDAKLRKLVEDGATFGYNADDIYAKQRALAGDEFFLSFNIANGLVHIAQLGDEFVWVANYPYAAFRPMENYLNDALLNHDSPWKIGNARPSRATIYLLRQLLKKQLTEFS